MGIFPEQQAAEAMGPGETDLGSQHGAKVTGREQACIHLWVERILQTGEGNYKKRLEAWSTLRRGS